MSEKNVLKKCGTFFWVQNWSRLVSATSTCREIIKKTLFGKAMLAQYVPRCGLQIAETDISLVKSERPCILAWGDYAATFWRVGSLKSGFRGLPLAFSRGYFARNRGRKRAKTGNRTSSVPGSRFSVWRSRVTLPKRKSGIGLGFQYLRGPRRKLRNVNSSYGSVHCRYEKAILETDGYLGGNKLEFQKLSLNMQKNCSVDTAHIIQYMLGTLKHWWFI